MVLIWCRNMLLPALRRHTDQSHGFENVRRQRHAAQVFLEVFHSNSLPAGDIHGCASRMSGSFSLSPGH